MILVLNGCNGNIIIVKDRTVHETKVSALIIYYWMFDEHIQVKSLLANLFE